MQRTRWPAESSGGAFLVILGIALAIGSFFDAAGYLKSLAAGFIGGGFAIFWVARTTRARFGRPTRSQRMAIGLAIAFEIGGIVVASRYFNDLGMRDFLFVICAVVAGHFLILSWSFGPIIAMLGGTILVFLMASYWAGLSTMLVLFADGFLKVMFGGAMARRLAIVAHNVNP